MVFFNALFLFVSIYFLSFLYYFSFNENVLLIGFLGIFLYVIQKGLSSAISEFLDKNSLELYLNYKEAISLSVTQLLGVRSKLSLFLNTRNSTLSTLATFIDCHLVIASFIERFNELFYEYIFQLNLINLFVFQRFFVKQEVPKRLSIDFSEIEFES